MVEFNPDAADQALSAPSEGMPAPISFDAAAADGALAADARALLAFSAREAVDRSPEQVAYAARLSRSAGAPIGAVLADMPSFEAQDIEKRFWSMPEATRAFLTDPTNASLAHDDAENLARLESVLQWPVAAAEYLTASPGRGRITMAGDVLAGFHQANVGAAGLFRGAFDAASAPFDVLGLENNPARLVSDWFSEQGRKSEADARRLSPPQSDIVAGGVSSGVQSLVQSSIALPLALLPGGQGATLGILGSTSGGQSYQQAREQGINPAVAVPYAVSQGLIEFATEKIPVGRLIGDINRNTPLVKTALRQIGAEILGEQIATASQDLNDWAVLNPEQTIGDYLSERPAAAAQTLIATMVAVGGNVAVAQGLKQIVGERSSAHDAIADAQHLAEAAAAVQESKLAARDPETMAAFIRQVAGDGPLHIPAESLSALYQSGVIDRATLDALEVADQLPEALTAGGDVLIAPDKYLLATARLTPEALSQVISNTRRGSAGMTAAEAEAFLSDAPARDRDISDLLERMAIQYEGQQPGQAVEDEVASVLAGWPGQTKTSAQPVAALWRERYLQRARDRGMDPDALWVEERPRFLGPRPVLPADDLDLVLERLRSGRAVQTPRQPVLGIFRAAGGVRPGSGLAQDLQAMGITPKTAPGLFRDNGIGAADRIVVAEHEVLRDNGVRADANGYADHDGLMQAVGREWAGDPLQTENERARIERLDQPVKELRAALEAQGIVPEFATKEDVLKLMRGDQKDGKNSGVQFPGTAQTTGSGKKILTDVDFVKPLNQPGGEQIRGSYDPVTDTIRAFDQADLSTVLHEGGHRWLFEMIGDLADPRVLPEARARIVRDLQTVMDWLGVKIDVATASPEALREALTVEHHEQWARGSEAYLMEGKAPSAALRPVFARFAAWLTRIYRTALNLDVRLTPQVRGVFDRLLASDAAIAEAEADSVYRVPSELSGVMTAAERREIEAAQERAAIEARAELQGRVMRELARERLAWWREEKGKVRKEVEAELRQQPAYRLIDLSKGLGPDGQKLPDGHTLKLDRRVLIAEYGEEIIGLLPKGVTANDGGVNHHIVAGMLGAENGDALRLALMEARATPLKVAAVRETDRIMHARHGDMVTDGRIAEDAADIVATSRQVEAVALQEKYLRRLAARPIQRVAERKQAVEGAGRVTDDRARVDLAEAGIDQTLNAGVPAEGATTAQVVAAVAQAELSAARTQRAAQSAATKRVRSLLSRLDHAAIRDIAERFVQTRIVSQAISAERYRAQARRHERAAELAIAKRDYETALAEKQQQLLNMEMERAARHARQDIERIERRSRRLNKPDAKLAKTTDQDFFKAARAVLARYGLARADDTFDARAWIERLRNEDPEGAVDIEAMIGNLTSYPTYGRAASKIMASGRRIDVAPDYRDMRLSDLLDLRDGVAALLAMGRNARTAEIGGERIAFDEITAQMKTQLAGRVKPRDTSHATTEKERQGMGLLGIISSLRKVESWARDLDDGRAGAVTRYIVRPIHAAIYQYKDAQREILTGILKILRPGLNDLARPRTIAAPEIGFRFDNKGQLIHAILHSGNESNLRKLLLGRGWGTETNGVLDRSRWDAFMRRVWAEGVVTKADMDMAQGIWDLLENTKPAAQKAHRAMFGINFKEIEAAPIQTPFGTYRGGYVPAIVDRDQAADNARHLDADSIGSMQDAGMFPAASRGFTKSRTDYVGPLALDLTLIPAHVNKVLLFSHVGPAIRQTARLIKRRDFGALMSRIDPTAISDMLIPWLNRTARQAVDTPTTGWGGRQLDAASRYLRRTAGLQAMVGNVVNTAQQFTGLVSAMVMVPPSAVGRALIRGWRDPKTTNAAILGKSAFMRDRMDSMARDVAADIDNILRHRGPLGTAQAFAVRHGYFAQQIAQNMVDRIVWAAAYDTAVKNGEPDTEAVQKADSTVRLTQGSFNPEDLSRSEGGTPFLRMFTMFYNYFNAQGNLLFTETSIAFRTMEGRELARRLGAIYMFGAYLPAVLAEIIAQAARGELGDEDDDGWLDDLVSIFVLAPIRFFAALAPAAGPFVNTLINASNDKPYDDRLSLSPVASLIETAIKVGQTAPKALFAGGDKSRAVSDAMNALSIVLGIPTGFLRKPLAYATDVAEGDSRPRHVGNVVSGILTGQDGTAR